MNHPAPQIRTARDRAALEDGERRSRERAYAGACLVEPELLDITEPGDIRADAAAELVLEAVRAVGPGLDGVVDLPAIVDHITARPARVEAVGWTPGEVGTGVMSLADEREIVAPRALARRIRVDALRDALRAASARVAGGDDAALDESVRLRDEIRALEGGHRRLALRCSSASEIEPQPVSWTWPRYLPAGKIADAFGDGDMGKSMVLLDLAARVSIGARMPDGSPGLPAANVMIFAAEDDGGDTIRPRLEAAGADLDRCFVLEGQLHDASGAERWLSLREHMQEVRDAFREHRPRIAIFDPVMAFLGNTKSGIDSEVRETIGPLKPLAAEVGTTIINLRHINKGAGLSVNMRGTASTAFRNLARAGLVFAQHPDDDALRVMAVNKSNLAERPPSLVYSIRAEEPGAAPRVVWHGPCDLTAGDLFTAELRKASSTPKAGSKVEACTARIREWIADEGAVRAREIEAALVGEGYGADTIKKAKKYAGVVSKKDGTEGWYWSFGDE